MGASQRVENHQLTIGERIEIEERWLRYHEEQAIKETEAANQRRTRLDELRKQIAGAASPAAQPA